MQHPIRAVELLRLAHGAVLASLIAGDRIMVRYLIALAPQNRGVRAGKLALIGRVRGEDLVIGVEHDHRLRLVFEKRNQ